jgi:hypothetical protein
MISTPTSSAHGNGEHQRVQRTGPLVAVRAHSLTAVRADDPFALAASAATAWRSRPLSRTMCCISNGRPVALIAKSTTEWTRLSCVPQLDGVPPSGARTVLLARSCSTWAGWSAGQGVSAPCPDRAGTASPPVSTSAWISRELSTTLSRLAGTGRGGSGHSLRAVSGPVIRFSSGRVPAMIPRDTARPAMTVT